MKLIFSIFYIAALGILSHCIGEALPRRWFDPDRGIYAPRKWEEGGRIYRKLKVQRWKDFLPDMSKVMPDMVRKGISMTDGSSAVARVAVETCVAEAVHWVLFFLSGGIYLILPTGLGMAVTIIYALSHIPFIIIQRYNRPTLSLLAKRLKQREERIHK